MAPGNWGRWRSPARCATMRTASFLISAISCRRPSLHQSESISFWILGLEGRSSFRDAPPEVRQEQESFDADGDRGGGESQRRERGDQEAVALDEVPPHAIAILESVPELAERMDVPTRTKPPLRGCVQPCRSWSDLAAALQRACRWPPSPEVLRHRCGCPGTQPPIPSMIHHATHN